MKFHLNYIPQKPGFEISHHSKVMMIGSCFSDHIGGIMEQLRFNLMSNPSGILFNPLSIYNCLKDCVQNKSLEDKFIIERGGEYFSFLHHSSVKDKDRASLTQKINQTNFQAFGFLKQSDVLIITFGTAFYYKHHELNANVANCHKQPGSRFSKMLLPVTDIVGQYSTLIAALTQLNPKLRVIFTVSPVKYLKDGLAENNISKATLLLSVNELAAKHENCYYFPAFELVNDDLRDYRFYKQDMAHPNELAINYVWEKFSDTFFSDRTKILNEKLRKLNAARNHKPLHHNVEENLKFEKHISDLIQEIRKMDARINITS